MELGKRESDQQVDVELKKMQNFDRHRYCWQAVSALKTAVVHTDNGLQCRFSRLGFRVQAANFSLKVDGQHHFSVK